MGAVVDDGEVEVRDASTADAAACAAIYAPYVTGTAISFETEPPSEQEMARRIEAAVATHAWLVAEHDGAVVGYAYAGPFKARAAYRWSCEVSAYVDRGERGRGTGRSLYVALLARLAGRGYRTATAGMTLPNAASAGFHAALGFESAGTYRRIGFKHGAWHDVAWVQRSIGARTDDGVEPPDPR